MNAQLAGPIRDVFVGADALSGNEIRRALTTTNTHPRARIAADLALYDLVAKFANLPCYSLWGGAVRPELKVVRMVGIKPAAELVAAIRSLRDEGYSHFKIKIGTGVAEDLERIRAVRESFGSDIWISVDGNSAYTVTEGNVGGWALTALTCTGGGGNTTTSLATKTASIGLDPGESVTWSNDDGAPHGLEYHDGVPGTDLLLPGASFSRQFDRPGTYDYNCSVHPYMTGRVIVRAQ